MPLSRSDDATRWVHPISPRGFPQEPAPCNDVSVCESDGGTGLDRRGFLALASWSLPVLLLPRTLRLGPPARVDPVEVAPGLTVYPRTAWAGTLRARRKLKPEPDVKFLLVHHSAGATQYTRAQVPSVIRNIFLFHTGGRKGWPDTCYNFFVDRYGQAWEGRTGSLEGPVMADATGGSQGFAQLVCLLGDFETTEPTPEMIDGLSRLLGWLGKKYGIDLDQSHTVGFVSRGSNKWRKGAKVRARPISGHRDMTYTVCPGKHVYPLLARTVPRKARAFMESI